MYFSKNSRYVLQKARVLSSKFLVPGKRLSIKSPKDDPTKPPLRVNVPKDIPDPREEPSIYLADAKDPGSATLVKSKPSYNPTPFEDDILSGGNVEFPTIVYNEEILGSDLDKKNILDKKPVNTSNFNFDDKSVKTLGGKDPRDTEIKKEEIVQVAKDETNNKNEKSAKPLTELTDPSVLDRKIKPEDDDYPLEEVFKQVEEMSVKFAETANFIAEITLDPELKTEATAQQPATDPKSAPPEVALSETKTTLPVSESQSQEMSKISEKQGTIATSKSYPGLEARKAKQQKSKRLKVVEIDDPITYVLYGKGPKGRKELPRSYRVPETEFSSGHNYVNEGPAGEEPIEAAKTRSSNEGAQKWEENEGNYTNYGMNEGYRSSIRSEDEAQVLQEVMVATEGGHKTQKIARTYHHAESYHYQTQEVAQCEKCDESYPYLSIHELKPKKQAHSPGTPRKSKKKFMASMSKRFGHSASERLDTDAVNFQTAGSHVSFGCDKISANFGAAFPPLLNEALKNRFKFKKGLFSSEKFGDNLIETQTGEKKVNEYSENSILFPKKENFDCESLFTTREDVILNLIKNSETKKSQEVDQTVKAASENLTENNTNSTTNSSIDSLVIMKKVREIVQFDLDNAVKIFKDGEPGNPSKEVSSVVLLKEDGWKVDYDELEKLIQQRKSKLEVSESPIMKTDVVGEFSGDKVSESSPKILPPRHLNKMKLHSDSVVTFNPQTNEFYIHKEALAEAISRKTNEPYEDVKHTLDQLSTNKTKLELKRGDSILVFDEATQTWKVDFSILERREQQLKLEEELTKRSELILETFENFEKGQSPSIQMPNTRDTKTFDYKKEQWNSYNPENKSKSFSKSPFKESNAEEIRKQNSDLYENLFIGNKKDTEIKEQENPTETSKKATPPSTTLLKLSAEGSGTGKDQSTSETTSDGKTLPPSTPSDPAAPPQDYPPEQTPVEDNYWDAFLRENILPRDISEISKIKPPPPPPASKIPPFGKFPPQKQPDTKPPKLETPQPKAPPPKPPTPTPPTKSESVTPEPKKPEPQKPEPPKPDQKKPETLKPEPKKPEAVKPDIKKPPLAPPTSIDKPPLGDPKSESPVKIDEPKFRIRIPFIKDKKIKTPDSTTTPSPGEEKKTEKSDNKAQVKPEKIAPEGQKKPPVQDPPTSEKSKGKTPPTNGAPKLTAKTDAEDKPKPPTDPKKPTKMASASEHYISDNIIKITRNKSSDNKTKVLGNKIETVKVNMNSDARQPSKVTEINLNKQSTDMKKTAPGHLESKAVEEPSDTNNNLSEKKQSEPDNKSFYKKFEKYKTPYSEPDFEEKARKIRTDIESNPNMKKLDNWNKTLVLQNVVKPPDNIENWLKDETDKMATLLLKVLHEAGDGKTKRKPPAKSKPEKQLGKGNPYDNIRKKQENNPENFLFRVRTVNWSLENGTNPKQGERAKVEGKPEESKNAAARLEKKVKTVESLSLTTLKKEPAVETPAKSSGALGRLEETKPKTALEEAEQAALMSKEYSQVMRMEFTEDVPGPEILKKISNAWKMFPILGSQLTVFTLLRVFQLVNIGTTVLTNQSPDNRRTEFSKLFTKYGPIVNIQGPLSGNVILIHTPEHLTAALEQDVCMTTRSVFDSLEQVRHDYEDNTTPVSIFSDWSKPQWNELRRATNDPLVYGSDKYFDSVCSAGDTLVSLIRRNRNAQQTVNDDFMEDIQKWSLEGLCKVLFEKSFGFLEGKPKDLGWVIDPSKMYLALEDANTYLNKCERGFQLWRLMSTPSGIGLGRAYRALSMILSKQIYQSEMNLRSKYELLKNGSPSFPGKDLTFIESMMLNDGMTLEEITCNLVDIILIGTNMMSSTIGFLLYHLSRNVKAQINLAKEVKEVLREKDTPLNYSNLSSMKYLHACIKECLRLHFPIPVFYRLLQNDVLLANYIIPKSTFVVMDFRVSGSKEQIFEEPDQFIPERWLSEEKWMMNIHPFTAFPFCHGPRAELAKRVTEMQLMACVAKIIRNFQIEYHYGEIQGTDGIVSYPDKPLKFSFTEREA